LAAKMIGVSVVAVILTAVGVVGYNEFWGGGTPGGTIDVVAGVDTETAAFDPTVFAGEVRDDALTFAAKGGGVLRTWVASGNPAVLVGDADLHVLRDGRPEGDERLRNAAVDDRVKKAMVELATAMPSGTGRSLWATFSPLTPPTDGGRWIVYVSTFGPGTSDPEDVRQLMATEPDSAVASLPDSAIADLHGAEVHVVFAAPAGEQPVLNSRTAEWRRLYVTGYIERAGGTVASMVETGGTGIAATKAPAAPVVDNLPDPTPHISTPTAGSPMVATLDGGALFYPNSERLISESDALAALRPLGDAWASGQYSTATCEARAARFGPSDIARTLTDKRAAVGVALLAQLHVPATGHGLGYGSPLPGIDPQSPLQRVLTCVLTP
jgi:hypothetical protein